MRTHCYEVARILTLRPVIVVGDGTSLIILRTFGIATSILWRVLRDGSVDAVWRQVYLRRDGRRSSFLIGAEKVAQGALASSEAPSPTHLGALVSRDLMTLFLSCARSKRKLGERKIYVKTLVYSCGFGLSMCIYLYIADIFIPLFFWILVSLLTKNK